MNFYRLIKPDWGKPLFDNGEPNPDFKEEIKGPNTIEGFNFSSEFLAQKNQEGYNVYWFPNHPSTNVYESGAKWLASKHIDVFDYVFVDMDLKDGVYKTKDEFLQKVSEFPVKPTMTVNSGNGIHVYWQISGLSRDAYVLTQVALINHFNTDDSIYTVLQLMRVPGYWNTKRYKDYVKCEIIPEFTSGQVYNLSALPTSVYTLPPEEIARAQKHLDKIDGKYSVQVPDFANLDELPDKFLNWIVDPKNNGAHTLFFDPKGSVYKDRSKADMALCNVLFKANFNRKEALAVLANTEKARSHADPKYYARLTVDKVYIDRLESKYLTVGQKIRTQGVEQNLGEEVKGTWFFDTGVLGNPWRKREVLGLIAGAGVGKTTITLKMVKDSIENNPENDDIAIFFSLEMPEADIIDRWVKLVGPSSPLADRLYVIGNEEADGTPRNIGLQEIVEISQEIMKGTGKNIRVLAIDHVGIVAKHIDMRKKYTFGIQSEIGAGWGDIRTLSLNSLATQMKSLAKILDTYVVVLTQTTKEKGQGDTPIDKDGAYGISQYENIMDRIITAWQPLQRIQNETPIRFLAWQYVKIRNKHIQDKIQTYEPKLLTYDLASGDLRITTQEEYQEFLRLKPKADAIRESMLKKKPSTSYSIHITQDRIAQDLNRLHVLKTGESNDSVAKVQSN